MEIVKSIMFAICLFVTMVDVVYLAVLLRFRSKAFYDIKANRIDINIILLALLWGFFYYTVKYQ